MSSSIEATLGSLASDRWALVGADLVDPATRSVTRGGILIDGDRIVDVGLSVERAALGEIPCIDATGRFVLPGLIDAHLHLAFDGGPRPIERYLDDGVDGGFATRLADAALTALLAGSTTIRDLGGPNAELFDLRDRIEHGDVRGPRLLAAGLVLTPPAGHCHFIARQTDGPGLAAAVDVQAASGADCIKVMVTGGVHTPGSSSGDVSYELAELGAAVAVAHRAGRRITGHATNATGIERAALAGFDSIQHGTLLDHRLAGLLAERGTTLVPTLGTHAAMTEHQDDPRIPPYVAAKAGDGTAAKTRAFRAAVDCGVTIAAGTDGGVTFVGHGSLGRELALFREAGLGAWETLAAATSVAADEVGRGDQIGRLAAAFAADLLVLDRNPIIDVHALDEPAAVIARGAVVTAEGGRFAHAGGSG